MTITALKVFLLLESRNTGQCVCPSIKALGQIPHHARVWVKTGNFPLSPGWGTGKNPAQYLLSFGQEIVVWLKTILCEMMLFTGRKMDFFPFWNLTAGKGHGVAVGGQQCMRKMLWSLFLPHLLQPCGQRCPPWASVARQPHRNRETSTLLLTHPFGTWALWGNPFSQEGNDNKSTCGEA